jgi:hypothetical protein
MRELRRVVQYESPIATPSQDLIADECVEYASTGIVGQSKQSSRLYQSQRQPRHFPELTVNASHVFSAKRRGAERTPGLGGAGYCNHAASGRLAEAAGQ